MSTGAYAEKELMASAARTASGTSAGVDVTHQKDLTVYVNCTAVAGTSPTLNIIVQDSVDGTNWFDVATLPQLTAVGKIRQRIEGIGNFVRVSYTIGGTTPSFTFDVQTIGRN